MVSRTTTRLTFDSFFSLRAASASSTETSRSASLSKIRSDRKVGLSSLRFCQQACVAYRPETTSAAPPSEQSSQTRVGQNAKQQQHGNDGAQREYSKYSKTHQPQPQALAPLATATPTTHNSPPPPLPANTKYWASTNTDVLNKYQWEGSPACITLYTGSGQSLGCGNR
jgi:hypothetical protein